jgi:hypothetical protein
MSEEMALKTVKKSPYLLSFDDSMDEEELALFARKFKKMFRKGSSSNKPFGRNERPRGEVRGVAQEREEPKDPRGLQCHECLGFGHIRIGNLRMNNGRALQMALSNDEETHEEGNFLAFVNNSPLVENVASSFNISTQNACSNPFVCSEDVSQSDVNHLPMGISVSSDDESNGSICSNENAIEEQNPFDLLMEKFNVLRKDNLNHREEVWVLELEKSKLRSDLKDAHAVCNTLKFESHVLISKVETLEKDLEELRNHLNKFDNGKLYKILSN